MIRQLNPNLRAKSMTHDLRDLIDFKTGRQKRLIYSDPIFTSKN
tara:strand:- start:3191 stop:3322 length:132 start_codon:yes stop_codon:yes gene_type:complete